MKYIILILLTIIIVGALFFDYKKKDKTDPVVITKTDTIISIDTVYPPIPEPQIVYITRLETVFIDSSKIGSDKIDEDIPFVENDKIMIPITQAAYKNDSYKLTIEGYKPKLLDISIYPKLTTINTTDIKYKSPRWAITIGAGVGITTKNVAPHIGITAGYVLWSN